MDGKYIKMIMEICITSPMGSTKRKSSKRLKVNAKRNSNIFFVFRKKELRKNLEADNFEFFKKTDFKNHTFEKYSDVKNFEMFDRQPDVT